MFLIIGVSGVTCGGKSTLAHALNSAIPNSHLLCQDDYFLPVESERHTWIPELSHINWELMTALDMEKMWKKIMEILNIETSTTDSLANEAYLVECCTENSLSNTAASVTDSKPNQMPVIGFTTNQHPSTSDGLDSLKMSDDNVVIRDCIFKGDDIDNLPINEIYENIVGSLATEVTGIPADTYAKVDKNKQPCSGASKMDQSGVSLKSQVKILILEGFLVLNYSPIADLCNLKYYLTLNKEQCRKRRNARTYNPADVPGYFDLCIWPEYENHRDQVLQEVQDLSIIDGSQSMETIVKDVLKDIDRIIHNLTDNK